MARPFKRYWVSFELAGDLSGFEYHGPWWVSGYGFDAEGNEQPCVCLAVIAQSEAGCRMLVSKSFDKPPKIAEWRFINERDPDWSPFCDRFEKADWMVWPITMREALDRRKEPANG